MSNRLTNTQPNPSKRFTQRPSLLKPGQPMRFNSKQVSLSKQNNVPQPISHAAKRNAYDRIKKIETLQKQKGSLYPYEQLIREVKNILKEDIDIPTLGIFPGEPKNETGRAILSDGTFFVAFSKIVFRCQYAIKKAYLQKLKDRFLPKVSQNKTILMLFLEDEEEKIEKVSAQKRKEWLEKQTEKIKEQLKKELQPQEKPQIAPAEQKIEYPQIAEPSPLFVENMEDPRTFQDEATMTSYQKDQLIRKPCIKPPSKQSQRKSVRWSQIIINDKDSGYLNEIVNSNRQFISQQKKEDEEKEKKQKIAHIRKTQSFLIDFFEINDIYDLSMVDIVGIVDQIDDKYVIILVKQKNQTPPPSFVKTRSSKMQENEYMHEQKSKRQMLAIGLLKRIDVRGHEITHLKEIQCKYQDIWAYVDIEDPESLFLSSLPEESISDIESFKKQKKN